jgi:hypothetical protein
MPNAIDLNPLIEQAKKSIQSLKVIALPEAWKLLQLAIADIVQNIEIIHPELKGADKKVLAMGLISDFYDKVFIIISIPFVPSFLQPIISKYIKAILMMLVGATIDALVTTFRNTGIFNSPNTIDPLVDNTLKVSDK